MALKQFGDDFNDLDSFITNVQKGDTVKGFVNGYSDFGAFVTLGERQLGFSYISTIKALVPMQYVSRDPNAVMQEVLPLKETMEFRVQHIDREKKRIKLSTMEFDVGERRFKRPTVDVNYDEPIDNSKVEIPDGDKEICIRIPDKDDERLSYACRVLRSSIRNMENENGSLEDYYKRDSGERDFDELDIAKDIISQSFAVGMPTSVFLRNLTYEGSKGDDIRRLGFRLARQMGDYWHTELRLPLNQTFLFEGRIAENGRVFSVDKILLIACSTEALPYEVILEIINQDRADRVCNPFIGFLLDKMASYTKYTSKKLTLWMEYLDWCKKVAELQIKGAKYVHLSFEPDKKQLVFGLLFKDENEFKQMQRILRRQEISAFSNNVSTDRLAFRYDKDQFRAKSVAIGSSMGMIGKPFGISEASRYFNLPLKSDESKTLSLEEIEEHYSNPFFVRWGYALNDDDLEKIEKLDEGTDGEDVLQDDFISSEILDKYRKDGFLALSAVGDLALITRFRRAIEQVKNGESFNPHLEEWLFDITRARLPDKDSGIVVDRWLDKNIASNPNQREAIEKMLRTKDLFLLQGPPGTGKTTVIAEAIFQFAIQGKRVLLSSQSNDAVDNALERLVKTPEIRAVRLLNSNRRFQRGSEDSLDKLSEDTALSYYYESLSDKITDRTLGKWERIERGINECQKDSIKLRAIRENIDNYIRQRNNAAGECSRLQESLIQARQNVQKARGYNESVNVEKKNFEEFKRLIAGENADFALSDGQLDALNRILENVNDSDFTLWNVPSNFLTNHQRNEYLGFFIINWNSLKDLKISAERALNTKVVGDDIELKKLTAERDALDAQMDKASSEEEYDELEGKLSSVKRKIREITKKTHVEVCSLNSAQKQIFAPALQEMFSVNRASFLEKISAKIAKLESSVKEMISILESRLQGMPLQDILPLENQISVLDGKNKVAQETLNSLNRSVEVEHTSMKDLFQKYKVQFSDNDKTLEYKISQTLEQLNKELKNDSILRNDFGDLLKGFKDTLEEHIRNPKLLQNDNDNYLSTYINSCNVVGFSCTADPRILTGRKIHDFDVVIIDEVSKATPPELLLPLMKAEKVVLVGDHRQLPPMFKTNERSYEEMINDIAESDEWTDREKEAMSKENFDRYKSMVTSSLFKEYFEKAPNEIKASLLTQYRMHIDIMNVINRFYDGKLVCGVPEAEMETRKAHGLTINTCKNKPFVTPQKHAFWIDSSALPDGTPVYESFIGSSSSACNYLEENIVVALLRKINNAYLKMGYGAGRKVTVGVISFYQAAVNNMRRKIKQERSRHKGFDALDISTNTVDRFQGQEKNIVIVSLVRSKEPKGPNGVVRLSNHVLAFERINVAFSRAQNLLFIVGAKKSFESLEVTLPMMDKQETHTVPVYKNIMADLYRKACLVDSDCVIDEALAAKTLEECSDPKNRMNGKQKPRPNGKNQKRMGR